MTREIRSRGNEKAQLALLGLLIEKERYGYELEQEIKKRKLTNYVPFTLSGLYHYLRSFQRAGWIKLQSVKRMGKYPERNVYKVTKEGYKRFRELMEKASYDLPYDILDAALAFSHLVSLGDFQKILIKRKEIVDRRLQELQAFAGSPQAAQLDLIRQAIVEHGLEYFKSQSAWLDQFIEKVSKLTPEDYRSLTDRYWRKL